MDSVYIYVRSIWGLLKNYADYTYKPLIAHVLV